MINKIGFLRGNGLSEEFSESYAKKFSPKYGLPGKVVFCDTCVISNQRPNSAVEFLSNGAEPKATIGMSGGICEACRVTKLKTEIDWDVRFKELEILCDQYRRTDGSYDCLVPGSGGKDSFFASRFLKEELGMHPLTATWAPHLYTDWGRSNFDAWVNAGFDNVCTTPNPRIHRLLTRLATERLLHPFQPFMLGQKGLAPNIAKKYGIDLVFFGENEAEYGNPVGNFDVPTRDSRYFSVSNLSLDTVFLGGMAASEIIERFNLELADLAPYLPTSEKTLEGIAVHYLGYYVNWHPQGMFYYTVDNSSFRPSVERSAGTYSRYNSLDDKIDDLHYYTTGVKFGLGRASYDAAQEIRNGDISRSEGVQLVRKYDHEFPERFISECLDYLSIERSLFSNADSQFTSPKMSVDYFTELADSFRSGHLWWRNGDNYLLRNLIGD